MDKENFLKNESLPETLPNKGDIDLMRQLLFKIVEGCLLEYCVTTTSNLTIAIGGFKPIPRQPGYHMVLFKVECGDIESQFFQRIQDLPPGGSLEGYANMIASNVHKNSVKHVCQLFLHGPIKEPPEEKPKIVIAKS